MDDFALLQAFIKNRSDAAFGELMDRHLDLVYTAARRRTADAHLAEDVTQAVFIILYRKAASFKSDVILPAWLLHVTRLTAYNALRQRKNQIRVEQKAASITSEPTASLSAEEKAFSSRDADRIAPLLDDAMGGLEENDRNALVLRFFMNFSLAEVGLRLGVTSAAAEKRVSRAVERLRKSLVRGGIALTFVGLERFLENAGVLAAPADVANKLSAAISTASAGIKMTTSVELADRTVLALKTSAIKYSAAGAAMQMVASFAAGILLTYTVMSHWHGASTAVPLPSVAASPVTIPPAKAPPIATPDAVPILLPTAAPLAPPALPAAQFAPPEELVSAQGPRINLLARVDLAADNLNGEWQLADGALQSGVKAYSVVQLPYAPPEEYDYHATFTVQELRGEVVMVCARKGADFGWQMAARENRTTIFDISPTYNNTNPSRHDTDAVLKVGVPYQVTVQVRNSGVAAYLNGKLVGKLQTDYRGFGAFQYWQLQNRSALGVGTWGTIARFEKLEVVEISGPGTWLREAGQRATPRVLPALTDAEQWEKAIDLLPQIDPERDAVSGKWGRTAEGAMTCDDRTVARLELPYKAPEEYDYKIVFTRNAGWDTIAQCFCHGKDNLIWGMAMWGNELNMFRCISAFEGANPTSVWAKEFIQNGQRYESIVQVRKHSYAAFVNGKLISSWDRDEKGAHVSKEWKLPTPGHLGIAASNCKMTFHSIQVLEISGAGTIVRTKQSKRQEALPGDAKPDTTRTPSAAKPPKPPNNAF